MRSYLGYLLFQLRTHADFFAGEESDEVPALSLSGALACLVVITLIVAVCSGGLAADGGVGGSGDLAAVQGGARCPDSRERPLLSEAGPPTQHDLTLACLAIDAGWLPQAACTKQPQSHFPSLTHPPTPHLPPP